MEFISGSLIWFDLAQFLKGPPFFGTREFLSGALRCEGTDLPGGRARGQGPDRDEQAKTEVQPR